MHYNTLYTWLEGKFWVSFPSAAPQGMSKKAFTPLYWGRGHTNSTMFGLIRMKLNSALLPKTMSQQPALPRVSRFHSSKKHPRNHRGLNGFNFALFSRVQSYNYLTPCQRCPFTQGSHTGQDNNDNDGVFGHILTLKVKLCPVSQWLIERKGKCLAALELLMN